MSLAEPPPHPPRLRWFTLALSLIIVLLSTEVPPNFAVWLCSDPTLEHLTVPGKSGNTHKTDNSRELTNWWI